MSELMNIFDIKRFALNDGPGIRTTVFLKGCPLKCLWCHNPESISSASQIKYNLNRCICDGACANVCPENALQLNSGGITLSSQNCNLCFQCVEHCSSRALESVGYQIKVDDLMQKIVRDISFYDSSNGGVTFSGGEPLLQLEALLQLLHACGRRNIHRVIDTSLFVQQKYLNELTSVCDLLLVDLKCIDSKLHQQLTGVDNQMILDNIRWIANSQLPFIIRIPIIKGANCTSENIQASIHFLKNLPQLDFSIELIPYHDYAQSKYFGLQNRTFRDDFSSPTLNEMQSIVHQFVNSGLSCLVRS